MLKIADPLTVQAMDLVEREEFVRMAIRRGLPLARVEEYLDWLDSVQAGPEAQRDAEKPDLRR